MNIARLPDLPIGTRIIALDKTYKGIIIDVDINGWPVARWDKRQGESFTTPVFSMSEVILDMPTETVKLPNTTFINGYSVHILRFNSRKWGAEWRGYDGQLVRVFRPDKAQLLAAIEGTMRLREDI